MTAGDIAEQAAGANAGGDLEPGPTASVHNAAPPPYSVFTGPTRIAIVCVASLSAFMSSFTVNIYFPAITEISHDLGVSLEKVNLTVTLYFVVQGFTPVIWSSLADSIGRRPIYVVTYTIYVVANILISVTDTYASLVVLRMAQATGAAASMAISAGTVADVFDREHRGTYMGIVLSMSMIAPAVAPVISGVLSISSYGWRTVFLFLLALSVVDWTMLVFWMPETGRNIVGNGSVNPKKWYSRSVLSYVFGTKSTDEDLSTLAPPRPVASPLKLLKIAFQKDVIVVLLINGIFYLVFCGVTVGATATFTSVYRLSTLKVGLCYLPLGAGCSLGSIVSGRWLDWDYRKKVRELGYSANDNDKFPLEQIRLQRIGIYGVPFMAAMIAFGWTFRSSISLAVPLVLMFLIGFGLMSIFTLVQVLLTDLYPNQSASVNATNNLIRCELGAASAALVDIVRGRIGIPWTYTLLALLCLLSVPLILIEWVRGSKWRRARNARVKLEEIEEQRVRDAKLAEAGVAEDVVGDCIVVEKRLHELGA